MGLDSEHEKKNNSKIQNPNPFTNKHRLQKSYGGGRGLISQEIR